MTPLEIFLALWAELIPIPVLPHVEAVNSQVDTNTLPDIWGTAMYQPEASTDVTLGSQPWVEETGTFLIGLFTRSGDGPAALDAAVAAVRRAFHGVRRDGLLVLKVDGPLDTDPDGTGEWWQLHLVAHYMFQTRRDASGPLYGGWQGFPDAPTPPPGA
jgi:Bacteriophage related domain of unknown function